MNYHRPTGYHSPGDLERVRKHKGRPCPMCRHRHGLRVRCR